jgi:hypothetical protein
MRLEVARLQGLVANAATATADTAGSGLRHAGTAAAAAVVPLEEHRDALLEKCVCVSVCVCVCLRVCVSGCVRHCWWLALDGCWSARHVCETLVAHVDVLLEHT